MSKRRTNRMQQQPALFCSPPCTHPPDRVLCLCGIDVLWPPPLHMAHRFGGVYHRRGVGLVLRHLWDALRDGGDRVFGDACGRMVAVGADVGEHLCAAVDKLGVAAELAPEADVLVIDLHAGGGTQGWRTAVASTERLRSLRVAVNKSQGVQRRFCLPGAACCGGLLQTRPCCLLVVSLIANPIDKLSGLQRAMKGSRSTITQSSCEDPKQA